MDGDGARPRYRTSQVATDHQALASRVREPGSRPRLVILAITLTPVPIGSSVGVVMIDPPLGPDQATRGGIYRLNRVVRETGTTPVRYDWGMARVAVVGAGYVGLTTAACLAHLGHKVCCSDMQAERVASLCAGEVPIVEED